MREREYPVEVDDSPGQQSHEEAHGQLSLEGLERAPDQDSGSSMQDPETIDPLTYEDEIVWIHEPQNFDFVRVTTLLEYDPSEAPYLWSWGPLMYLVGYSTHRPDAPPTRQPWGAYKWERRAFHVRIDNVGDSPKTRETGYESGCPKDSVDPLTVFQGASGEQNERAWGGSNPWGYFITPGFSPFQSVPSRISLACQ